MKASEEKEIRNMKKKTEKKLKEVREKEAKLKLDQSSQRKPMKRRIQMLTRILKVMLGNTQKLLLNKFQPIYRILASSNLILHLI